MVWFSDPSFPFHFGSRGWGCAFRLWSRGHNGSLCACCLCPPFPCPVMSGETCRTPMWSFWRFRVDLYKQHVKVLVEVTQPYHYQNLWFTKGLSYPYLLVWVKVHVQLIRCWLPSMFTWVWIFRTFISWGWVIVLDRSFMSLSSSRFSPLLLARLMSKHKCYTIAHFIIKVFLRKLIMYFLLSRARVLFMFVGSGCIACCPCHFVICSNRWKE